jgi:hypothetical protein
MARRHQYESRLLFPENSENPRLTGRANSEPTLGSRRIRGATRYTRSACGPLKWSPPPRMRGKVNASVDYARMLASSQRVWSTISFQQNDHLTWPLSVPRILARRWLSANSSIALDTDIGYMSKDCRADRTWFFLRGGKSSSSTAVFGIDTQSVSTRRRLRRTRTFGRRSSFPMWLATAAQGAS